MSKAISYLLVIMLLVGVVGCGEELEKAATLPSVAISDITDTQVQTFIDGIRETDKEKNGWNLYPNIEYVGNGEMRIEVNHRWFSAPAEMAIKNAVTVYKYWAVTARNKDVTLTIMFEDFEYIKFQKGEGKVVISDQDNKEMIKRIKELEEATSRNHKLRDRAETVSL